MNPPNLYIVEGPDCSGKTALAKFMCRVLPAMYVHATGAKSLHMGMLDYHMSLINDAAVNMSMGQSVVMDRLWPSEHCYGSVLRPHVSDKYYSFTKVFEALKPLSPHYIFCGDPLVQVRFRTQHTDSSHHYDDSQFAMICGEYKALEGDMLAKGHKMTHYSIFDHGADINGWIARLP